MNNRLFSVFIYFFLLAGVGRILPSRSKFSDKVQISNGDQKCGFYKFDLEIREADVIEFFKTHSIFNGENFRGRLIIKNHLQIDKISNVVSINLFVNTSEI